ncbi:SIS domain-containing protein [Actinomadura macrotermitis]|uniref:Glutamine--fructose-6-phosphate aminotransferase [isomerizing] n=1 Tax=Actinomadura macrotermitis TaxID=2585200 RepID=A0A7K0BSU3_9ACTN|nr:sugar isomerase [Actinomadura macrotermitis]MQY04106.1 Glutamine--fructose-6-phosphate aminotransferase [isomerizing] [Actinomadura macrotermitis]
MGHTEAEIADQPAAWRRAAGSAAGAAAALPRPGERVAVVGCGTSWFAAQCYAALREAAGHGETDAFAASEAPLDRPYDRLLALTRSGTTTEVLDALRHVRGRIPTVAITADPATPVRELAGETIVLDYADERSVVQTRFATTQLVLLRAHLGEDLAAAVADAERALAAPLPDDAEQYTFLGRGWTVGLAHEAALKMREAAGAWTESYPAMEYRHGPISIAAPGRVTWMFGEPPAGLADQVAAAGGTMVTGGLDPLAELIRVQRLAVRLGRARGADPDNPRNLTRSVILGTGS